MVHLSDPRIGIAGDDSYAPFQPRVAFTYSSAVIEADAAPVVSDAGIAHFEKTPFSAELSLPDAAIADAKARAEDAGTVPLSEYQWSGPGRREPYRRALDVALSFVMLLSLAPLLAVVALAIRVQDGGPILVSDRRIGRFGREIDLWSFRTKALGNPQMTSFGRFLRRSGISSLPRILNVYRGDLSLVGPRPITEAELPRYGLDVIYYLASRPGLTGQWRVKTTASPNQAARWQLEREYARTRTFKTDLKFMLVTLPSTLAERKAA